ncbi:MAG: hypothetical protein M3033_16820, partial [Acidobacteriota bacterium]|nr:hypothetical protein [Acidobacteriota bacterium]
GRRWRPLVDTARAVQFTYGSPRAWLNERRRVDYYYEGSLIWLEADVLIRQKSNGKLSLDDFFKRFHGGGQNTAPKVLTYDFEQVARTLNEVLPYDWRTFLNERIYKVQTRAPLGGIKNGGWRLVYNDTPNVQMQIDEHTRDFTNLMYSIGILVSKDGVISDINPDLAAAKIGLAPGMKITKISGEDFSAENLHKAIAAAKTSSSIEIVADNGGFSETYKLNYNGGERYPHLERDASKPDTLSEIVKSHFETQGFVSAPTGFVASEDPHSFILSLAHSGPRRRTVSVNKAADVTSVLLNQTEITATCSANSNACSDKNRLIEISSEAIDPENDVLTYNYTVTGGKIIGQGSKVVWDLSGEKPGTYTITVGVDNGCGVCGKTITKEVKVVVCLNCQVN